jgi:tRNA 2-selenouridine synthase
MNTTTSETDLDIHPFDHYGLILDARSEHEFAHDHLPGAINLPVVNDEEYAIVGTQHKTDKHKAYITGVAFSLKNMANSVENVISKYPVETQILVYCFRGGKRSRLWADALKTIGYHAKVLPGGWKNYRRWILTALETVPVQFNYKVLAGPTGCGKTRLLESLQALGEQVLDLEGVARHRGSLIGKIPGVEQPTQMQFDSDLIAAMRAMDPSKPIWVEAESKKIGNIQLPASLINTMHLSPYFKLKAPMSERVRLWHEDYGHFENEPELFLERLQPLRELLGNKELDAWKTLADKKQFSELFERIMTKHYDPAYLRSSGRNYANYASITEFELPSLDRESLNKSAQTLINNTLLQLH